MSKARWSLKFKAGLYVGFFTIFFIITLMAAVGFGFDRYYYFMKKEAMSEASQKISTIYREEGKPDESQLDDLSQLWMCSSSTMAGSSIHPGRGGGSLFRRINRRSPAMMSSSRGKKMRRLR